MIDGSTVFDLFVIGGGVNGAGIARDASGRGLHVALVEQNDLAEGTSSRSGKLIHGGLRYLEYYEFRLVRDALIEREVLLASAPHIIWPMRFVLPHSPQDRPMWLIRLGLFLYDHLGGRRRLAGTRTVNLHQAPEGANIQPSFKRAFEYSDCWVDDARLVILNALDAHERGALIMPRTRFVDAVRSDGLWHVTTCSKTGIEQTFQARALVNAAGPWVNTVMDGVANVQSRRRVRLVKGSHIVVPKFWDGDQAYLVQHTDKRVIFINPYEKNYALIGTTDIPQEGRAETAVVEDAEVEYLLAAVARYFKNSPNRSDVLHSFTGVRPLFDDDAQNPSAVTRDYTFDVSGDADEPPILSIFGGKITTFRKLAEQALDQLAPWFEPMQPAWTKSAVLPGGDIPGEDITGFANRIRADHPWLPKSTAHHLARLYGSRTDVLLANTVRIEDLGEQFSTDFFAAEARYLIEYEWARTAEDILHRRTKHHLHMSEEQTVRFKTWLAGESITHT